jgi:hypothetical protein
VHPLDGATRELQFPRKKVDRAYKKRLWTDEDRGESRKTQSNGQGLDKK